MKLDINNLEKLNEFVPHKTGMRVNKDKFKYYFWIRDEMRPMRHIKKISLFLKKGINKPWHDTYSNIKQYLKDNGLLEGIRFRNLLDVSCFALPGKLCQYDIKNNILVLNEEYLKKQNEYRRYRRPVYKYSKDYVEYYKDNHNKIIYPYEIHNYPWLYSGPHNFEMYYIGKRDIIYDHKSKDYIRIMREERKNSIRRYKQKKNSMKLK